MPVVKKAENRVSSNRLPVASSPMQTGATSAEAFGAGLGRDLQGFGNALGNAGKAAYSIEEHNSALKARNLKIQAEKEIMQLMYDPDNGLLNSRGVEAIESSQTFKSQMGKIKERYMGMDKSPMVQNNLSAVFKNLENQNLETMLRHESQERRTLESEMSVSEIGTSLENVALNYTNDDVFIEELANVRNSTLADPAFQAASSDGKALMLERNRSNLYATRIQSLLSVGTRGAAKQAADLYDRARNNGNIIYEHALKIDRLIDSIKPQLDAQDKLDQYQGPTQLEDRPVEEVFDIGILTTESNAEHFEDDGVTPKKSYAGAIGIAQVLPSTGPEAAKAAGLEWDEFRFYSDPEYNAALGRGYFKKQQKKYGSNALAALAYNWGPGNVDKHIKKHGDPRKGEIGMQAFLAKVPSSEARQYVPKVMKNIGVSVGKKIDPVDARNFASDLDPDALAEFDKMIDNYNKRLEESEKIKESNFLDNVMPKIQQANGDWTVLSPEERAAAKELGVWNEVTKYDGEDNPEVLAMLYKMSDSDLMVEDLNAPGIRTVLSGDTWEAWMKKQRDLRNGKADSSLDRSRKQIVDQAFMARGVAMDKKGSIGKTQDDAATYARFNQFLDIEIENYKRRNNGAVPDNAKLQEIVDFMFMGTGPDGRGKFDPPGAFNKRDYYFDIEIDDVPEEDRLKFSESLTRHGMPVTDTSIIRLYARKLAQESR